MTVLLRHQIIQKSAQHATDLFIQRVEVITEFERASWINDYKRLFDMNPQKPDLIDLHILYKGLDEYY